MKSIFALGIVLAACASTPGMALSQDSAVKPVRHHHARHYAHKSLEAEAVGPGAVTQIPPATPEPTLLPLGAPYPAGQGDVDGLSRHINDCNKGCIGGNPG